jgi:hypothetical protein
MEGVGFNIMPYSPKKFKPLNHKTITLYIKIAKILNISKFMSFIF